jgi:HipA-like protein
MTRRKEKPFGRWSAAIRDQFESWGLRLPAARGETGLRVGVYVESERGDEIVGWLSQDAGEFVFKYDPGFVEKEGAEPISAFPDLQGEYRSKKLWPFFAVRIPPLDRADVRNLLRSHHISADDQNMLELLGTLAKRSISNRYELRISGGS